MRMTISLESKIPAVTIAHELPSQRAGWLHAAVAAALMPMLFLFGFRPLAAQAPVPSTKTAAAQKPVNHRKRPSAAHPVVAPAPPPAFEVPEKPPAPDWPANDKPSHASVVWDSQGLLIEARNSSLEQILKDVSTATGAKVDGLDTDQRVFGVYGPGQARDVLSQLLQGSGYNVMLIGDEGQGTPRQILLSSQHSGESHPAPTANQTKADEEDNDADEQQPQEPGTPQPGRPAFAPGVPPRSPQQIMQEMQQRQQETQQRLQNRQENQPPNQPTQPPANPQN
jgi:hypothetical protein